MFRVAVGDDLLYESDLVRVGDPFDLTDCVLGTLCELERLVGSCGLFALRELIPCICGLIVSTVGVIM